MGIFSRFFQGTEKQVEVELKELYSKAYASYSGQSISEARRTMREAIKACKEQAHQEGTDKLPDNFGTLLITKSEKLHDMGLTIVENARLDGARDEDIEEWWNLHDLQRRMVIWHENALRYASFLSFREDGLNADEAMARVRVIFPMYGDPNDTTHTSGDDRPLRHELRGRVDRYRERYDSQKVGEASKHFTTFNAFVRSEMRSGHL
jgi:predicted RNase H-like HicB family nuclease